MGFYRIKVSCCTTRKLKLHSGFDPLEYIWHHSSGVARAFPGGRFAHPEGQNEEENK